MKKLHILCAAAVLAAAFTSQTLAQPAAAVTVEGAWARTTVPGQKGTGAFMKLTSKSDLKLVGATSAAAGITEVHEMKMEGDVMRMRAIPALDLPAGKAVEFKPGGFHIMLLDLKMPLAKDTTVPVTLLFKDAKGATSKLELLVPVAVRAPGGNIADDKMEDHKGHKR